MRCETTGPTTGQMMTTRPAATDGAAELEDAACPNGCPAAGDALLHEFGPHRVYLCGGCGLARLTPRLAEAGLADFYEREYFTGGDRATGYDSYERDAPLYERTFARRLKLIGRFAPAGRLLDIGCGPGYFLNVAARAGYEVHGLDLSGYAVERAAARFPGRVRRGPLAPGLFPDGFFDVVTMFDLFEHVYHPGEFLRLLHGVIRPAGLAVVTTPNRHSLLARASGRNWVSYKIPEHVYYYTPATLRRAVAGLFRVELIRSEGQYCSLEFLAERVKTLSRPAGGALLRAVRAAGLRDVPLYVNSGSMTAVLRKV